MAYSVAAAGLAPVSLAPRTGEAKKSKSKTVTQSFSNTQTIDILQFTTRSAKITVSGFKKGKVTDVNLTLHNLSHQLLGPVSFLLVAPDGSNIIPVSDVIVNNVSNVTLTLDDSAGSDIPADPPLTSGTYRPRNYNNDTGSDFNPMDVPPISGNEKLSTFNGINPNGEWTLYVYNANASNPGALAGGWSLEITARVKKKKK
ncbi:MAG: hypothetical protein U0075_23195 [Thermomicrobiales bacterium]